VRKRIDYGGRNVTREKKGRNSAKTEKEIKVPKKEGP